MAASVPVSSATSHTGFDIPEYVAEEKIWTLPGSSVLVTEDEPGSVIAHTLS